MIALHDIFEPTRASLFHQKPLLTFDIALDMLIFEKNCQTFLNPPHIDTAMATFSPSSNTNKMFCKYCKESGH